MNKFSPTTQMSSKTGSRSDGTSSIFTNNSSKNYKVTFNKNSDFDFYYDDDYIDFDEFEKWSNDHKNKTPSLK